jgi:predicted amidohydrolase
MRIAGIQLDIAWEDKATNYDRVGTWIETATQAGARLVVLPEMYSCGFSMNTGSIEEPVDGPSAAFIVEQAQHHGVWVCGSVPERPRGTDKPFNTLVLGSPGGQAHRYRKIHPFTFAREDEHYGAGTDFLTVDIEGLRCTFFICYDLRFADEFWNTASGTDCYVVVANWPEKRRHHWTTLLQARSIENQAYVVGLNRVGEGGGLQYAGDSRIYDPWGEALATGAKAETMLLAEVDPAVVQDARTRFPILPDRR